MVIYHNMFYVEKQGHFRFSRPLPGHTAVGVIILSKQKKVFRGNRADDLRINPQLRLCPKFDETSIAMFRVADPGEMGMRVLDNCAEEHIM